MLEQKHSYRYGVHEVEHAATDKFVEVVGVLVGTLAELVAVGSSSEGQRTVSTGIEVLSSYEPSYNTRYDRYLMSFEEEPDV